MPHYRRFFFPGLIALAVASVSSAQTCSSSSIVRFQTTLGGIDVILTPSVTPLTVANFLSYVCSGAYTSGYFDAAMTEPYTGGTIVHRSLTVAADVPPYIIQGGGYALGAANIPALIPQNAPVNNEFKASNIRGTIAMALYGSNINSATNEWYFNTQDNSSTLDSQDFTVFGNVANNPSLAVMDAINSLPTFVDDFGNDADFGNLPLQNYSCPNSTCPLVKTANYIFVNSITPIVPATTAASFQDAATFASLSKTGISPGELITLYGTDLGPAQVTTLELDSTGTLVTNLLEGTQVLFNNIPAPVIFTYTGQLAVVVPYEIAGQSIVNVVVSYLGLQTSSLTFNVVPATPGLFTLNSSGKGDASIIELNGTVVSASSPASPGDILELYGEGYGTTSPAFTDGIIVTSTPTVPVTLLIDGKPVPSGTTSYTGPAYGDVAGVLQVNFTVPQGTAPGSHQIQIQVGSAVSPTGVTLATH